jgi:hypothetical protein
MIAVQVQEWTNTIQGTCSTTLKILENFYFEIAKQLFIEINMIFTDV